MESIDQVNYIDQTTRIIWHFAITAKRAFDENPMPSRRYKGSARSITARRAFDRNPMPSKRAFRGMAGLAVLYPSVVDYIGWSIKTL